jgi:very-short-patch-repair endonuclease
MNSALLDSLDRHARRRAEGIPTLSTLVGPPERALALWTQWVHRRGLGVAVAEGDDPRAVVSTWARALARERDLTCDAENFVVLSQSTSHRRELLFRGKTLHERRVLLEGLTPPRSDSATWELCRHLLESPVPPAPGELPTSVDMAIQREPLAALQALLALVPFEKAPVLRVRAGPSDFRALRTAASLCAAAPALTAMCVLAPEALAEHLRRGESRVQAMLREGQLDVPEASPEAPAATPASAVVPTLARLQQEGLPEPILARYVEAARAITAARREAEDRARSEQERFLYELLQHRPTTQGLFALNAPVHTGPGGRSWEVDLLCRELRLAVELDGDFHFRDDERFRRDRRKDLALQRAGYWVVRFLSDDVIPRLEEILETLDTLIAARRQESSGQETPHGHR